MRYRIRVPLHYPYKNELTPSVRIGAFVRFQRIKREWGWMLKMAKPSPRPQGQLARRLHIIRVYSTKQRPFDVGNLYYPAAIIIDHLVNLGWLRNDSPKWLADVHCSQRKSGSTECWTEIVVEDVDMIRGDE